MYIHIIAGVDPGFLDKGYKLFTKGVGFVNSTLLFLIILAAPVQYSARSLHGNRMAVLWHSQTKYVSVCS